VVTQRSPSASPSSTATRPPPDHPARTRRGSKRPAPFDTNTYWISPVSTRASAGTTIAFWSPRSSVTSPYMPGRSFIPAFLNSIRAWSVRLPAARAG
jgi:hypothetical protein